MNKPIKSSLSLIVSAIIIVLSLSGCSGLSPYAKRSVYQPPLPASNEALLYLFREDTIAGGAWGLTFVADNIVVAELGYGSFSYARLPANKEYEVVAIWGNEFDNPKFHYRVYPSPGETLYIMFNNSLGERGFGVTPIDKSLAEKFIREFEYRELKVLGEKIGVSYNDYFDRLTAGDVENLKIDNQQIIENRQLYKKTKPMSALDN